MMYHTNKMMYYMNVWCKWLLYKCNDVLCKCIIQIKYIKMQVPCLSRFRCKCVCEYCANIWQIHEYEKNTQMQNQLCDVHSHMFLCIFLCIYIYIYIYTCIHKVCVCAQFSTKFLTLTCVYIQVCYMICIHYLRAKTCTKFLISTCVSIHVSYIVCIHYLRPNDIVGLSTMR